MDNAANSGLSSNLKRNEQPVIPSQFSNWRGNPPRFPGTFGDCHNQSADWFRNDKVGDANLKQLDKLEFVGLQTMNQKRTRRMTGSFL